MISEIVKAKRHRGRPLDMYFWQDKSGNEIDCVLDVKGRMLGVEVKAGETVAADYFKNIAYWRKISGAAREDCFVVHAGELQQEWNEGIALPWTKLGELPL